MEESEDENCPRPRGVNVIHFVKERVRQIAELIHATDNRVLVSGEVTKGPRTAVQHLPRHMRRRAMSYNIKRFPRMQRRFAISTVAVSKHRQKPSSRFWRRRPRNLLLNYIRRQRKHIWLETHIWHAKRFRMIQNGATIYLSAVICELSDHRIATQCDIALFETLASCAIIGTNQTAIIELLRSICAPEVGPTFACKSALDGRFEIPIMLYEPGEYPRGFIGPARFLWSKHKTDQKYTLAVWTHPSSSKNILLKFIDLLKLKKQDQEIDLIKISKVPRSIDEWRLRNSQVRTDIYVNGKDLKGQAVFSHMKLAAILPGLREFIAPNNAIQRWGAEDADTAMKALQSVLFDPVTGHKIRLEKAKSNTKVPKPKQISSPLAVLPPPTSVTAAFPQVCCKLRLQLSLHQQYRQGLRSRGSSSCLRKQVAQIIPILEKWLSPNLDSYIILVKIDFEKNLFNNRSLMPFQGWSDQIVRLRLYGPKSFEILHEVLSVVEENEFMNSRMNEFVILNKSNATFLAFVRYNLKNGEKILNIWVPQGYPRSSNQCWRNEYSKLNLGEFPDGTVFSLLVEDPRLSRPFKKIKPAETNRCSTKSLNMANLPLPLNDFWNFGIRRKALEKKLTETDLQKNEIPILLIVRNTGTGTTNPFIGLDLIIPSGFGLEFWLALQYGTARSIGLKDQKFLELESSHFNFPADVPDCDAGLNEFKEEYINLQEKYIRRPHNRRVKYWSTLSIKYPFTFQFSELSHDWLDNSGFKGTAYVIRDHQTLLTIEKWLIGRGPMPKESIMNSAALVPVSLVSITLGRPQRFALICAPVDEDIITIANMSKGKNAVQIVEQSRRNTLKSGSNNEKNEEKQEDKETKNQKEKEREKRKAKKRNVECGPQTSVSGQLTNGTEELEKKALELVKYSSSCSRPIIGRIVRGDYSFVHGKGFAIGYCCLPALKQLYRNQVMRWCKYKEFVCPPLLHYPGRQENFIPDLISVTDICRTMIKLFTCSMKQLHYDCLWSQRLGVTSMNDSRFGLHPLQLLSFVVALRMFWLSAKNPWSIPLIALCVIKHAIYVNGKLKGRVCAYGDMDRDLYTDIVIQDYDRLKTYFQNENGEFHEAGQNVNLGSSQTVSCAIGDFNGDSVPDILPNGVKGYESTVYIFSYNTYKSIPINATLLDELAVMDVNGDGISDVVGFLNSSSLFCQLGSVIGNFSSCEHFFNAEIIFGTKIDNRLKMQAWRRISNELWELDKALIADLPAKSCPTNHFGAVLFADFDADGIVDIGLPCCADATCRKVVVINMWNHYIGAWQDFHITGLEGSDLVSKNDEGNVVFRVGDFSLDGYPDLIALVREKTQNPMILENVPCTDCISNASSIVFDLKEDGTLDVLLEYKDADQSMAIDFIKCEDKGDTTFLKVQVFSSSCDQFCGSTKTKIGILLSHMSDSWGHDRVGSQCQMPQTTHRALHTPFALFGLGRSPNFVDYVHIGSPRVPFSGGLYYGNQHYYLKQIVPNSRLIVVPPKGDGIHWQSRLYLTPSQLIKQSLMVLVSVCMILLLVVVFLHYRERRADKHERQAQSHRFHFDAM
ncbi:hypothetical protein DINM_002644 [Dirofilaria immitis]|nr:hypothetical protein [Dirofilaria immitis]